MRFKGWGKGGPINGVLGLRQDAKYVNADTVLSFFFKLAIQLVIYIEVIRLFIEMSLLGYAWVCRRGL